MEDSGDLDFSMSGLKTAVLRYVKPERAAGRDLHLPDLAASFQEAIVDVQVDEDDRGGGANRRRHGAARRRGGREHAPARAAARRRARRRASRVLVPAARPVHRQRRDDRLPRRRPRWREANGRSFDIGADPQPKVGAVSTVLVTGGAGFIGSHLADRLLAEGHRVISVDDLTHGAHRQPRRGARVRQGVHVLQHGRARRGSAAPVRAAPAGGGLPPRGAVGRPPVPRRPRAGRQHQHHGHAQRARMRDEGRGAQGHLRGERRHDLRGATPAAGQGVRGAGLPPDVPVRHLEEGGPRLPRASTSATGAWTTRPVRSGTCTGRVRTRTARPA